jgi:hypothetical protein
VCPLCGCSLQPPDFEHAALLALVLPPGTGPSSCSFDGPTFSADRCGVMLWGVRQPPRRDFRIRESPTSPSGAV